MCTLAHQHLRNPALPMRAHSTDQDCDVKMAYFLDVFPSALINPESFWQDWQDEYKQVRVLDGYVYLHV